MKQHRNQSHHSNHQHIHEWHFAESRVADMSGIEALNKLTERYLKAGKKIHLQHLSADCRRLLANADSLIDVNIIEDPSYKVAVNA